MRVSHEFLHVLRRCAIWQQAVRISMADLVEMKAFKSVRFLCKRPANKPSCFLQSGYNQEE